LGEKMGLDIVVSIKPNITKELLAYCERFERSHSTGFGFYRVKIPSIESGAWISSEPLKCSVIVDIVTDENKAKVLRWLYHILLKKTIVIDELIVRIM